MPRQKLVQHDKAIAVGLFAAACILATACDPLRLPIPPDAGAAAATSSDGGDAGSTPVVVNGLIPTGAVAVEGTFAGDKGFYAWVTVENDQIKEFGLTIPIATVRKGGGADVLGYLPMPAPMIEKTPFKALSLMYLPAGHAPAGVYDVPHWEWHLLTITEAENDAVDCSDSSCPAPAVLPKDWFCIPTCAAKLGVHAFDLHAPEFNQERFRYGSLGSYYKNELVAVEPKITSQALLDRQEFTMKSFRPGTLGPAGLYPDEWKVTYNAENDVMVVTTSTWFTR